MLCELHIDTKILQKKNTWLNLEIIMVSERTQTQKPAYCVILFTGFPCILKVCFMPHHFCKRPILDSVFAN